MTAPTIARAEITAFAGAVRAALSDLPHDEIDDLTDGLEADLSERADDAGVEDFGDPVRYADELRAAAGLPIRSPQRSQRRNEALGEWAVSLGPRILRGIRSAPLGDGLLNGLISLRPVWWVLRGWALYQVGIAFVGSAAFDVLPFSPLRWLGLIALVVLSVQWGRGRWLPLRWLRVMKTVVSTIAALSLLVLVPVAVDSASWAPSGDDAAVSYTPPGLVRDGEQIGNIFAYDADGEPLTDVQLFDEDGDPLDLVGGAGAGDGWLYQYDDLGNESIVVPSDSVPGRLGWNVYPLDVADPQDIDYGREPEGDIASDDVGPASPPFDQVQPLAARDGTGASAGAAASPSPSPTPSPSLSPTPSPAP